MKEVLVAFVECGHTHNQWRDQRHKGMKGELVYSMYRTRDNKMLIYSHAQMLEPISDENLMFLPPPEKLLLPSAEEVVEERSEKKRESGEEISEGGETGKETGG